MGTNIIKSVNCNIMKLKKTVQCLVFFAGVGCAYGDTGTINPIQVYDENGKLQPLNVCTEGYCGTSFTPFPVMYPFKGCPPSDSDVSQLISYKEDNPDSKTDIYWKDVNGHEYVFHICDGAGTQGNDFLGNLWYVEHWVPNHYNTRTGQDTGSIFDFSYKQNSNPALNNMFCDINNQQYCQWWLPGGKENELSFGATAKKPREYVAGWWHDIALENNIAWGVYNTARSAASCTKSPCEAGSIIKWLFGDQTDPKTINNLYNAGKTGLSSILKGYSSDYFAFKKYCPNTYPIALGTLFPMRCGDEGLGSNILTLRNAKELAVIGNQEKLGKNVNAYQNNMKCFVDNEPPNTQATLNHMELLVVGFPIGKETDPRCAVRYVFNQEDAEPTAYPLTLTPNKFSGAN